MTSIVKGAAKLADTLDIIEEEYEKGNVDRGGGVPPHRIADEAGLSRESIRSHVRPLVEDGKIERVWGIGDDTDRPRRSYVPVGDER